MIVGIGNDLIEVERVERACKKISFLKKYYTEAEVQLIEKNIEKSADNFAVKEAVSKMFGTGFRKIEPIEIEVLRDTLGKPYVNLYGQAAALAKEQKINYIHVSITNTKEYASAFVVGESR